jgi:hypothetical protein
MELVSIKYVREDDLVRVKNFFLLFWLMFLGIRYIRKYHAEKAENHYQ